jgi:hypothetical protein
VEIASAMTKYDPDDSWQPVGSRSVTAEGGGSNPPR